MLGLCIFINFFFLSSHGLQPFKVYNLQKLKQNTNKNISLTTSESQILINSSILPVAAIVHPPLFLPVGTSTSHSLLYWGYVDRASSHCRTGGKFGCTESPSGMTVSWTETWTHVTNQTHTQGSVVQSDLRLGLLAGSRAKTDAWLFSAMLFPFCLAGSQEEQGLECEPFGGGLKDLSSFSCFAGAGPAGPAFPREESASVAGGRALPGTVC